MDFKYEALDKDGRPAAGNISAATQDAAIAMLQRQGLTLTSISGGDAKNLWQRMQGITLFGGVSNRDMVLLSRQIATLFEAQVSALRIFRLLSEQAGKPYLQQVLTDISDDLQAGSSISKALSRHPAAFSDFYINMVRAGEESGKLDQTFLFLADYIDRNYEVISKVRNALIYPAFILVTFIGVMIMVLVFVIPNIASVLQGTTGAPLPVYTQVVLGFSSFLVSYGVYLLVLFIVLCYFLWRYARTPAGRVSISRLRLDIPYVGTLYQKLYLSRIADNMHVMLSSGIAAVRALEITAAVVEDPTYQAILLEAAEAVKNGSPLSQSLAVYAPHDVPAIFVQMIQIGEETGEMAPLLDRLSTFYNREVSAAVDTLVSLIEPILIVFLAIGVGFLLASVLLPIYNTAATL